MMEQLSAAIGGVGDLYLPCGESWGDHAGIDSEDLAEDSDDTGPLLGMKP